MSVMELTLERDIFGPTWTLGALAVDGLEFGYCVEDYDDRTDSPIYRRETWGKLCIPAGRYRVDRTHSPRFGKLMMGVFGVPGRRGIRIHPGNDAGDTEGCLLPGLSRDVEAGTVSRSRVAWQWLDDHVTNALYSREVWITISRV